MRYLCMDLQWLLPLRPDGVLGLLQKPLGLSAVGLQRAAENMEAENLIPEYEDPQEILNFHGQHGPGNTVIDVCIRLRIIKCGFKGSISLRLMVLFSLRNSDF